MSYSACLERLKSLCYTMCLFMHCNYLSVDQQRDSLAFDWRISETDINSVLCDESVFYSVADAFVMDDYQSQISIIHWEESLYHCCILSDIYSCPALYSSQGCIKRALYVPTQWMRDSVVYNILREYISISKKLLSAIIVYGHSGLDEGIFEPII